MWKKCDLRICHSLCIHFFVHCTWYLCGTGTFESISIAYIYIVFSELTFFKNIFVCANKHTHTQYTCTYTYTILSPRKSSTWLHIISRFRFTIEFGWFWDGKRRISLLPHRHQLIMLQRIRIRIPFTLNHILANPKENHIRWFFCCFFSTIIFPFYALFYISNNCAIVIVQLPRFTEESPIFLLFSYHSSSKLKLGIIYSFQLFSLHAIQAIFWVLLLWFEFLGLLHSNKSVYESIAHNIDDIFFGISWKPLYTQSIKIVHQFHCYFPGIFLHWSYVTHVFLFKTKKKTDQILFCGKTIPQSLMIVDRCGKVLYRRLSVCLFVWLSFILQTKIWKQ